MNTLTTIVSIPGMISQNDWMPLVKLSEVEYIEKDKLTEDELLKIINNTDYLMLNRDVVDELTDYFYEQVRKRNLPLKAISTDITGMGWASPSKAKELNILLMNTPNYSTVSVAEFSLTSLFILIKKINTVWNDRLANKEEVPYKNDVLTGKTVGIIGLGNIGTKFSELLKGFNVKIIGWDRKEKDLTDVKQLPLNEVLEKSDYISVHLKTTDETQNMFTAEILSHCKPGQYIVNEADGKLFDNKALFDAIESGRIGGYAVSSEGVKDTPLATHDSVVTFPAQAWFTEHSLSLLRQIWVENIISAINSEPQNIVES